MEYETIPWAAPPIDPNFLRQASICDLILVAPGGVILAIITTITANLELKIDFDT